MFHISELQTVSLILGNSVWQNSDHKKLAYEIVPLEIKPGFLLGSFLIFVSFFLFFYGEFFFLSFILWNVFVAFWGEGELLLKF